MQRQDKDDSESRIFGDTSPEFTDGGGSEERVLIRSTFCADFYRASYRGRYFFIKKARGVSPHSQAIIRREYELSAGCDHPFIVHVFTLEESGSDSPEIWMEYVEGRNLSEFLAENPGMKTRKRVFTQILDAVGYLHSRGIVHNDLKPENILVTRAGDNVRIVDFGLSDDDAHFLVKTPGCTPAFAAPELRDERKSDVRSDIYSLGLLMRMIFPGKYGGVVRKCLKNDKGRRFDNTASLERAWQRRERMIPRLMVGALILIAIAAISVLFVEKHRGDLRMAQSEEAIRLGELRLSSANDRIAHQQLLIDSLGQAYSAVRDSLEKETAERAALQTAHDAMCRTLDSTLDRMIAQTEDSMRRAPTLEERARIMGRYWTRSADYFNASDWHYGESDFTDEMYNRMMRHFEGDSKRLGKIINDMTSD